MEISVASILQAQNSVTHYSFQERFALDDEGEKLLEPVVGKLEVTRASLRVLQVKGDFQTRLQLMCDRCGETFELPVEFNLDEALEIVDEPVTAEEVEDKVPADGVLDASDLIRQSLLLSLPVRHLCGCDPKNILTETEKLDPRWAALKTIKQEPNGQP